MPGPGPHSLGAAPAATAAGEADAPKPSGTMDLEVEGSAAEAAELRALLDASGELLVSLSLEGEIIFANAAWRRALIWPEGLGGSVYEGVAPRCVPVLAAAIARAATGQGLESLEFVLRARDGREVEVEGRLEGRYRGGQLTGLRLALRDVTSRREVEEELFASRHRLDLALEAGQTCTWECDVVRDIVRFDARWQAMLGGEAVAITMSAYALTRLMHPEDREEVLTRHRAYCGKGGNDHYQIEQRVRTLSGDWIWIASAGRVLDRDAEGRARYIIGTNTDITERKRVEAMVRRQRDFLAVLQQTTIDLLNRRGRADLLQQLVQRAGTLLEATFVELSLREDDRLWVEASTEEMPLFARESLGRGAAPFSWRAIDTREPVVTEDYARIATHAEAYGGLPLRAMAALPMVHGGECLGVLCVGRYAGGKPFTGEDIQRGLLLAQMTSLALHNATVLDGARAVAEAQTSQLRESEARFRAVFDASPVPIALSTLPEGRIVAVNAAASAELGLPVSALLGRTSREIGLWVDPRERERVMTLAQEQGRVDHVEVQMRRANGTECTVLFSCRVLSIGGRQLALTTHLDVTERMRIENRLRQSQRLEALGTLAGGIAHDFNNILTGMFGFTELARMELAADHPAAIWLSQMTASGDRAKELVRQILTFSRQHDGDRHPQRLQDVVKEALRLLRSTLPVMVDLSPTIMPQAAPVLADATQIHQVVMNLCTNAWHALPEHGGRVIVILENARLERPLSAMGAELAPGPYLRLAVIDNGVGMDAGTVERIFEPFFTTKPAGKGTGLGLAVVHGIVKAHGGAIRVQSRLGQGSTFEVYLPALTASAPSAGPVDLDVPSGGGQHILLVDDDELAGFAVEQVLLRLGYRVTRFMRAEDLLTRYKAAPGDVHLVLSDVWMPEMTGDELSRRLTAINPALPVVLISGHVDTAFQPRVDQCGARALIPKPPTRAALAKTMAELLGA
ncbi:MAG TPA: PAS domain S-box protein [Opitutaceae bacterium]